MIKVDDDISYIRGLPSLIAAVRAQPADDEGWVYPSIINNDVLFW